MFLEKMMKKYQIKAAPSYVQFVEQVENGITPSEVPLTSKEYDEEMKECYDNKWSVKETVDHFKWLIEDQK